MTFDANDIENAALCALKEAEGQGMYGCLAILWNISNRAWEWLETIHNVIYAKNQYSSMSIPSDRRYNWAPTTEVDLSMYTQLKAAAPAIFNRFGPDPTNGALYYENLAVAKSGWFFQNIVQDPINHPVTATIGHHTFFK